MDLLQGTLEMLVLRTLIFGPLHGYGIAKAIHLERGTRHRIRVALSRAEAPGVEGMDWIEVGCLGSQSEGQVLPADSAGEKATGG